MHLLLHAITTSSLLLQIDEDEEDGNAMEEEDGEDNDTSSPPMPTFNPESNEKIEELRKRLQVRISTLCVVFVSDD